MTLINLGDLLVGAATLFAPMESPGLLNEEQREIVVTASPLRGAGTWVADGDEIDAENVPSITDFLARSAPGVSVNEIQGNPLQSDVSYRGFTASPLLGTPQGLSVYVDGVRINQPFGDVVNWELVPPSIVDRIGLVSGSAPQFGRNSLGGALVIRTKDGQSDPGIGGELDYGSFDQWSANAKWGGHADNGLNWYVTADHFREDGWRDFSPSKATRAFGKLGWSDDKGDISLSTLFADTNLNGNGLQELQLLDEKRSSIYTAPDNTKNRSWLATLKGQRALSHRISVSANIAWRKTRSATYNGDVNDEALGQDLYQPDGGEQDALTLGGYTGFPLSGEDQANTPFPKWRCIATVLLNSEPNEMCNGLVNRSHTDQHEWSMGGEAQFVDPFGADGHHLSLGLSYVTNRATFRQSTQFGYLRADRTVQPVDGDGAYADGTQDSDEAYDARVDLHSRTSSFGIYGLYTARLSPAWRLDVGGRYDRTSVRNRDRITPGGGTGSLDSSPIFTRFNPSTSLTWQPEPRIDLSLSWSQASRAPSAIELGCSDPASPCRLPNALAGDPPLKQVIARTIEARAKIRRDRWSAHISVFRTDAHDDILFVSDDPSGYGYFRNFGKTRRQGVELEARAALGQVMLSGSYTYLDGTYRSPETVGGAANSSNDSGVPGFEGNIDIRPGDHIPLIPKHLFKAAAEWKPVKQLTLSLDMIASSGVYARGNENGRHRADGIYYLGPGQTNSYALFNLGVEGRPAKGLTLFASVRNLFDKKYATAAQLGPAAFAADGRFVARPFNGPVIDGERPLISSTFFAPGAPRSYGIGAKFRF